MVVGHRGLEDGAAAGFTVIEALVALLLGFLVGVLGLSTLARQRALQLDLARRGEALAAVRTTRHVLTRELGATDGSAFVGDDSLALRAFRGLALLCPGHGTTGAILVHVDGGRAPDPDKDSVVVLGTDGASRVLKLMGRDGAAGSSCAADPAVPVERWWLSGPVSNDAVMARYFERGSYHLSGGALRYRRGRAGRQPLTPQVLETPPSAFMPRTSEPGDIRVELFPTGAPGDRPPVVLSFPGGPGGSAPR